jgi:hypothetical protein
MNDQADPDVFHGGGKFLAIWSEFRTDYDIYGNLDAQVGVCEWDDEMSIPENVYPNRTLFTDIVTLVNAQDRIVSVYNVLGERIDIVRHGIWDARRHPSGIYFLNWADGCACRVIKIK